MTRRASIVAAALGVTLLATSAAPARSTDTTATRVVVTVSMYDMGFKLSKSVLRPGTAVFRTVNDGAVEHDFRIKGLASPAGLGTPVLSPGQRATLTVRFGKPGRYAYICTVPGHAAAGMKGKLVVRK